MTKGETVNLKFGTKVHYIPFKGADRTQYENGMVKSTEFLDEGRVFVVYHCAGEWDKFEDYTAASTYIKDLELGWV